MVLRGMLERAVRWNLLRANPASLVDLPRVPRREMTILSEEESRRLLDATADSRIAAFFVLALTTGGRLGEISGMQWNRIDLDKGEMRITHTLQETPGGFALSETKTPSSVRTNKLPKVAIAALKRHQAQQSAEALKLGSAWSNELGLVFTRPDGSPISRKFILRRELRPAARTAGLSDAIRTHDLRHTSISLLLNQGLPIPLVSSYVGHSDPSVTLRIYSHVLPATQHQIADAAQALFGA